MRLLLLILGSRFSKASELCVPTYIISTYFVMNFVETPINGNFATWPPMLLRGDVQTEHLHICVNDGWQEDGIGATQELCKETPFKIEGQSFLKYFNQIF